MDGQQTFQQLCRGSDLKRKGKSGHETGSFFDGIHKRTLLTYIGLDFSTLCDKIKLSFYIS